MLQSKLIIYGGHLLSGMATSSPKTNTCLNVVPVKKCCRINAVLEPEFPREMRNLFEAKLKGNGFYRTQSFQHLAGPNQPLFVQPILRTAPKIGMSETA